MEIKGQVMEGMGKVVEAEIWLIAAKYDFDAKGGSEFLGDL